MATRLLNSIASPRLLAFALLATALLPGSERAQADQFDVFGTTPIFWKAASPGGIWNDGTKTLTWAFNTLDFPQATWPTLAQAGAAFENAYRTIQDVPGINIKIVRGPDFNGNPGINDGRLHMCFARDETNDPFGTNISGAFAVTYVRSSGSALTDADVVMNGDPKSFPLWATTHPAPANSNDVEVTACHEQIHSVGGGHPVFFYAMVWPAGRLPELIHFDRCLSPDDRVLMRFLYPGAPALRNIRGTVTVQGGGACDRAVIVATNGAGVPQATRVTDGTGAYSMFVPAGAGYTVTAHHHSNTDYDPSDIIFGANPPAGIPLPATDFIASNAAGPIDVSTLDATNVNFTVTGGTPTMKITGTGQNGPPNNTQVVFAPKGSSGTMTVEITGNSFTSVTGNTASFGTADVTVGSVTAAAAGPNATNVTIPYTVAAGAVAGVRNMTFAIASGERVFVPAYFEVVDTSSTLTLSASAGNPVAGAVAQGVPDAPLLGFTLTANAVEDVRVRKLVFNLAGSGTTLPAVKLWFDKGTLGLRDAADVRIFTGDAYSNPTVSETLTATAPGTITFDNIAVTIPVGQSVNFLLTSNMPAAGSGTYTASLTGSAANIVSTGMYYGNVITSTGGATGGTQSCGPIAVGGLAQIRTTAGTVIPVGGSTNETQVTLRGAPTASTGLVGMDVELKPLGTPFSNTPSPGGSVAATLASGTTINIIMTGLTNLTSYHWQARGVSSSTGPGGWTPFGGNAESSADFSVDSTTVNPPSGLAQFQIDGITPVAAGGTVRDFIILSAMTGTNPSGTQVRLEFEVRPMGVAFTDTPTNLSGFVTGGTTTAATFSGATNDYHWQVRTANMFGTTSGWVNFPAGTFAFHMDRTLEIKAAAGCIGHVVAPRSDAWAVWVALALALLAVCLLERKSRKAAATLVLVLSVGTAAQADDDRPLPRSLTDAYEAPAEATAALVLEPAAAADRTWITLDAYLGFLFQDMKFEAVGTDLIRRKIDGLGTGVLGFDGLIHVHPDWRVGLMAEIDTWTGVRTVGAGAVGMWRFSSSHRNLDTSRADVEHYFKLALLYEKLTVTKSNFGSFKPSYGARVGYEARLDIGRGWAVTVGAEVHYSRFKYSPAVASGDTDVGGLGGLITVGISLVP